MIEEENNSVDQSATAALEILTGPARGTACWLTASMLEVSLDDADMIRVGEAGSTPLENGVVARLHRSGSSYEIEALEQTPLWINGKLVESKQLEQRDLIEFGDKGPLTRYRLHRQGDRLSRSLGNMLDDAIDYTRVSRKPWRLRWQRALGDFSRDFVLETTLLFRVAVIIALVILAVIAYQQYRSGLLLPEIRAQPDPDQRGSPAAGGSESIAHGVATLAQRRRGKTGAARETQRGKHPRYRRGDPIDRVSAGGLWLSRYRIGAYAALSNRCRR
jgi:hypothetical protein